MTTISEMFAEQEEDMARLNEIYQRVNERHEKMKSLMMMKEKMKKTPEPISPGISKDQLMERRHAQIVQIKRRRYVCIGNAGRS